MLRADYIPRYFLKFLIASIICVACAAWFAYDGFVKYPHNRGIAQAYETLVQEFEDNDRDRGELRKTWTAMAEKNGWPSGQPEKSAKEIHSSISTQYLMMVVFGIASVALFLKWFVNRGLWVEGDEELIRNSSGQELKISDITKIDKRKWEEKGLAVIHYSEEGKRKRKFVMDDFKFNEEAMGKIMEYAEANLKPDQIKGLSQKQMAEAKAKKKREREEKRQAAKEKRAAEAAKAAKPDGETPPASDNEAK